VITGRLPSAALVFLLALGLRAGWVSYRAATHGTALDYPDEELHWQLATNLVTTGTLVTDDGRHAPRMPLYPLLLAPFAALGPAGIVAAKLAQALLGAAAVLVARRWARLAAGSRAALAAGLLVACDPFAIFFSNLLLTEIVFTFLLLALGWQGWRLTVAARPAWPLLAGYAATAAALILTRPSAALLPLGVWGLVLLMARDRRRALAGAGLSAVAIGLALLPWGLRNRVVLGSFAWLSTNGGVTLYDAQGPQADGSSNQAFLEAFAADPAFRALDEVARDEFLRQRAFEAMRADPGRVLRLALVKLTRTWSPIPNVAEHRGGVTAAVSAAYTLLVLMGALLAAVRAVRSTRHQRSLHALLWAPVVYFTLVHCVYVGSVRYRVPLMPLLAIGTASLTATRRAPPEHGDAPPPAGIADAAARGA